jgi:hypothetical protein
MTMKEIVLGDVLGSGTLTFDAAGFSWTNPNTPTSYTLKASNTGELTTANLLLEDQPNADYNITTPAGTLLLVPQPSVTPKVKLTAAICDGCGNTVTFERNGALQQSDWKAGESTTYNFTLDIRNDVYCWGFEYTGAARTFVVPKDGTYRLEAWGASGGTGYTATGTGGPGGYCKGDVFLKQNQIIYVYVGSLTTYGNTGATHTFNGGGRTYETGVWEGAFDRHGGIGGGATDFRLKNGEWDNATSLNSRIMVAAGGGGGGSDLDVGAYKGANGGCGGGLTGGEGLVTRAAGHTDNYTKAGGGTQTKGGECSGPYPGYEHYTYGGVFGKGGYMRFHGGGGGSGYYGGGAGNTKFLRGVITAGGGGSSFISGMTGCVAINPANQSDPRTQDTGSVKTALNYNTTAFGSNSTTWNNNDEILFTNPSMIDGEGYEWNTGSRGSQTSMPSYSNPGSTMTGNTGHGHARITFIN